MALKREVSKLDEVEEKHRDLYVERNGKFYLDAEDANNLTSALDKERQARRDAEKAAKDFKDRFGDLDPEAAREALKMKQELEEKKLIASGEVDKVVEQRVAKMRDEHARERSKLESELKAKDSRLSQLLIDNALRDVALKPNVGILPKAIGTVVKLAKDVWKLDKDGNPVALNGDGSQMYGKDGGPIGMEEWISNLKTEHDYLFGQPSGGGAGNQGAGGGAPKKKRSEMTAEDREVFFESQRKLGKTAKEIQAAYMQLPA
jgi:hypothetical protein